MQDLREIIARNIVELRTSRGLTQNNLAEMLNYSDKAVSKWERGESVPDVAVLKAIADIFSVTVDYLITEDHTCLPDAPVVLPEGERRNRFIVSALATMLVWFIATYAFIQLNISLPDSRLPSWMVFIYAIPLSSIVVLVFNSIWGRRKFNYLIISILVWSALAAFFLTSLTAFGSGLWLVFVLGVPAEIIILLWSGLTPKSAYKR